MGEESKETMPVVPPAQAQPVPAQAQAPEIPPEQREFLEAMNQLILSAQELSYAVALLPNDLVETHPEIRELVDASKNVVRSVWRFHKLIKRRAGR